MFGPHSEQADSWEKTKIQAFNLILLPLHMLTWEELVRNPVLLIQSRNHLPPGGESVKPGAENRVHLYVTFGCFGVWDLDLSSVPGSLAGLTQIILECLKAAESSRCFQLNDICNETTFEFLFLKVNQQGTTQSTLIFKWRIIRKTQNKLDLKSVFLRVQIIELNFSFGATSRRTKVLTGSSGESFPEC